MEQDLDGWMTDDEAMYARITAPHFVAGITVGWTGKVVRVAPILNYMRAWDIAEVEDYCDGKGWQCQLH